MRMRCAISKVSLYPRHRKGHSSLIFYVIVKKQRTFILKLDRFIAKVAKQFFQGLERLLEEVPELLS